jgi:hypothetical protein
MLSPPSVSVYERVPRAMVVLVEPPPEHLAHWQAVGECATAHAKRVLPRGDHARARAPCRGWPWVLAGCYVGLA